MLRRGELDVAAARLGIAVIECGGHPDGSLGSTDPDVVMGEIVRLIRLERPDVVVTFGPEGAPTRHRDHRVISRLATAAVLLAGTRTAYPDQLTAGLSPHRTPRLCYVTWAGVLMSHDVPTEGQPAHIRVDVAPWLARKEQAFDAHRTQHDHRAHFVQLGLARTEEFFVAMGVPAPAGADDLFFALP